MVCRMLHVAVAGACILRSIQYLWFVRPCDMKYVVCHVWIRLLNSDAAQIASATEAQDAVEDHVVQRTQSVGRSLKAHLAM